MDLFPGEDALAGVRDAGGNLAARRRRGSSSRTPPLQYLPATHLIFPPPKPSASVSTSGGCFRRVLTSACQQPPPRRHTHTHTDTVEHLISAPSIRGEGLDGVWCLRASAGENQTFLLRRGRSMDSYTSPPPGVALPG